jgi:hypothetical protein
MLTTHTAHQLESRNNKWEPLWGCVDYEIDAVTDRSIYPYRSGPFNDFFCVSGLQPGGFKTLFPFLSFTHHRPAA